MIVRYKKVEGSVCTKFCFIKSVYNLYFNPLPLKINTICTITYLKEKGTLQSAPSTILLLIYRFEYIVAYVSIYFIEKIQNPFFFIFNYKIM